MDSAKAAVFETANQPMSIQSFPLPNLGPGETLVRITCCTVCGSDLHTFTGRRSTPVPTILGHEIIGKVVALGPGEPVLASDGKPLREGDRVTWTIAASCGRCFYCQHGIPQKCTSLFKYGHERITDEHPFSGGLAEYCHLAPGTGIVRLPDTLSDAVACPANCATSTVAAAFRLAGGCTGDTVLIQGAGMLGLTAAAYARAHAAADVIITDIDRDRLERAADFGADACLLAGEDADAIRGRTEGRGVDLAVELSGAPEAMLAGIERLRIGGRYIWVGAVFPSPPIPVSPEKVVRNLLRIQGLHNYTPVDLADAVAFLAENQSRFPFDSLVGETFPLDDVNAAFTRALASRASRVAVRPTGVA
ncbi:MAG TPA: zinc-binding dehydrogenase [Candidatus Hydrogenedentes bacterium]|nr:zinc-binding dehydrogenase [Candidatus Hydrogenedentota bacterium]HPG66908.1 zinc-binding dehydrogenase [Candidatus Hydrogenedentota bacterium]